MAFSAGDIDFMRRALALAGRGLGNVSPNPPVGCVIVKGERIVGEGWHSFYGGPHAEIAALNAAGDAARGATVYVTLMPCAHCGKTPPCTQALIRAGVARVVAAVEDPNPISGNGAAELRQAGVSVVHGLLAEAAAYLMRGFFKHCATGLPFVTWKYAMSLDGRVATAKRQSKWLSGEVSRRQVQQMRREHDAILVGVGTILADDPRLNVRELPGAKPLRIIADSLCRTPATAKIFAEEGGEIVILCTAAAPAARREMLEKKGARVFCLPAKNGMVELNAAMKTLADLGVRMVFCEAGPRLAAGLLAESLIDEVVAFVAPCLVGGESAPAPIAGEGAATLGQAWHLHDLASERLGDDFCLRGRLGEWRWLNVPAKSES